MTQAGPSIDLMSGEFFGSEPFAAYAWMREHAPVYTTRSTTCGR